MGSRVVVPSVWKERGITAIANEFLFDVVELNSNDSHTTLLTLA
jgi:hypothetical protein